MISSTGIIIVISILTRLVSYESDFNFPNYVGMDNTMVNTGEIDERGRVTIPKKLGEKVRFKAGARGRIEAVGDGVDIEKVVDLSKFIAELKGCIKIDSALDTVQIKEIWRTET